MTLLFIYTFLYLLFINPYIDYHDLLIFTL